MARPESGPGGYPVAATHTLAESDIRAREARRQLSATAEGQQLGSDDFAWEHTQLGEFESAEQGRMLAVPAVQAHQQSLERLWLIAPCSGRCRESA